MGITYLAVTDAQTAAQLGVNAYGIYVVDVVSGGPADKAGPVSYTHLRAAMQVFCTAALGNL